MTPHNQEKISPEIKFSSEWVPEGWEKVTLAHVGVITTGNTPPRKDSSNYGDAFPWVKPSDLDKDGFVTKTEEHLSEKGGKKARLLSTGAVMVSCIGNLGKVGIAGSTLATNQQINSITFFDGLVDSKYGFFYCKTLKNWLEANASATTIAIINKKRFSQAPFLLAPLAEQKRIVAKVDELLARVNVVRERLAKVKEILKRFRQSALAAACSGRLTADWKAAQPYLDPAQYFLDQVAKKRRREYEAECKKAKEERRKIPREPSNLQPRKVETDGLPELPDGWVWSYLPYLGYMNRGKSQHRPRNAPHLYGGPYPFIQTGDIAQSGGQITSHRQTYSEAGLAQSRLWPAGTVCITIAANIANSAILTHPACFPDSVVGVIPDSDLCLAEYLEYFIQTAKADIDQFAPATAQKNINIAILSDVAVPLPPLSEQEEIVHRVEALFNLANGIDMRVAAAGGRSERLTNAILARAFRGELVPTEAELARREGRPYEPASALLANIKTQRKNVKGKKIRVS